MQFSRGNVTLYLDIWNNIVIDNVLTRTYVIWRSKKTLSLHNISLNFYIISIYSVLRETERFNKFQTLFRNVLFR